MDLKAVKAIGVKYKKRKRRGRGPGSGLGKTAGRGEKGQKARAGASRRKAYEGGQMPLARRVPKRGFNNKRFRLQYAVANVKDLNGFEDGQRVDVEALRAKGLVNRPVDGVKILGDGELTKKLTVEAHLFSASAAAKIEGAGGQVVRAEGVLRHPRRESDDQTTDTQEA